MSGACHLWGGNEAEWTVFGRAYFDEALRRTYSFTEAFEQARQMIEEREREENLSPSEPQMVVGEEIRPLLEKIEQRLQGGV